MSRQLFFDLDGTLTDPRDGIVRSLSHALSALGRPIPAESLLERFIGPPLARVFETLLDSTDAALVGSAIAVYRERFRSVGIFENRVYPEIPAALSVLDRQGFVLQLVTSKPTVFARRIVDHFELSSYFRGIYGPGLDETKFTKGTIVGRALAAEAIPPAAAVMIGDRRDDVAGAREHGVSSIGVTWGYGSREELERAGADRIVDSVPALLSILGAV